MYNKNSNHYKKYERDLTQRADVREANLNHHLCTHTHNIFINLHTHDVNSFVNIVVIINLAILGVNNFGFFSKLIHLPFTKNHTKLEKLG